MTIELIHGDCLDVMNSIPSGSVDAVVTDPPYPEISRDYGRMTEAEWFDLMKPVVIETRRILTPRGSAVFILQPNSAQAGKMRLWLYDFLAWVGREWNLVQDVYWWNTSTLPSGGTRRDIGLLRGSIKFCVWLGSPSCYRNQDAVLWDVSDHHNTGKAEARFRRESKPSGHGVNSANCLSIVEQRGGVTPFNVLPIPNNHQSQQDESAAATPLKLCDWWIRYLSRPGDSVAGWFMGGGTTGVACIQTGRNFIGIEKDEHYFQISKLRIEQAQARQSRSLFASA